MKKIYILLVTLVVLNGLDYLTTIHGLALGAQEVNPLAQLFFSRNSLLYFKLIGLGILGLYLVIRAKFAAKSRPRITKVLLLANLSYLLIVIWNIVVKLIQADS